MLALGGGGSPPRATTATLAAAAAAVAIAAVSVAAPDLAGDALAQVASSDIPAGHPLLAAFGSATDEKAGFEALERASGVATIAVGSDMCAVVSAATDNAL